MTEQPYKGLMPYDETDAPFFFGREAEVEIISANLMASRLTIMYGQSGVGKSSLLRAGVVRYLRTLAKQNIIEYGNPEFAVVYFNAWRDDPIASLIAAVDKEAMSFIPEQKGNKVEKMKRSLIGTLRFWEDQLNGDLLIILDQFEEYFLYHAREDGEGTFKIEFPKAVNLQDLRVSFLISVREDAMAKLDRFKGQIPVLFDNYLRINHLDHSAARAAIEKPIAEYNRIQDSDEKVTIESELVEAILDQLKTGQVVFGDDSSGRIENSDESRIETPYLQLVLTRLWEEEISSLQTPSLRLSTLEGLGGAEKIVRTHLDKTMSSLPIEDQDAAACIFRYLITPSGTKIAHAAADLSEYTEVPIYRLKTILEKLSRTGVRIIRPAGAPLNQPGLSRYEIFHDVLASAIVDWRTRYERAKDLAEAERRRAESETRLVEERKKADRKLAQEKQRSNRLRFGIVGLSLMLLLLIGLVSYAFQQRGLARRAQLEAIAQRSAAEKAQKETEIQRQAAVARELSVAALNNIEVNPERSLLLAMHAVWTSISHGRPVLQVAEEALHYALQASRLQFSLGAGDGFGKINCVGVAFSPDGMSLATVSRGERSDLTVWNTVTGESLIAVYNQEGMFSGVAFNPKGRHLATIGGDNSVRIWDVATSEELYTLSGHSNSINSVAFSPDGRRLVTAGRDNTVRVWDAVARKELFTLFGHSNSINSAAFSSDGKLLATAGDDKVIKVWDVVTGKNIITMSGLSSRVLDLAFSPSGTSKNSDTSQKENNGKGKLSSLVIYVPSIRLAAAGEDGNTTIWDALSGQQLMTLYRMGEPNSAIAFDSTGTRLATGHSDGITRVLDVATGRVLLTLPCDTSPVRDIIFSPDGKLLATAGDDGKARVWDVSKVGGEEWFNLYHQEGPIRDITYGPDGKSLATVGDGGHVRVWDASNGVSLNNMPYHLGKVSYITFNQKGDRLAGLLEDKTIGVWDIASGKALIVLPIEDQIPTIVNYDIAFSIDGNRLAVCSGTRIQIYDLSTGKVLLSLSSKSGKYLSVAFSPDGNWFVTGSDTAIQLWDASTGKELNSLTNREGTAYSVALSNDGNLLAASHMDKTVRVWNVKTRNIHVILSGHKSMVQSLAFSPDGKYLAAACSDTTVKVWDVLKAENVGSSPLTLSGHDGRINKIVFSPDSQRLATACQDGTSRVYALNIEDLMALAKDRVTRELTTNECRRYLHSEACPSVH